MGPGVENVGVVLAQDAFLVGKYLFERGHSTDCVSCPPPHGRKVVSGSQGVRVVRTEYPP